MQLACHAPGVHHLKAVSYSDSQLKCRMNSFIWDITGVLGTDAEESKCKMFFYNLKGFA